MELREQVFSAGRAVLELVEREWQPLSAGELELRLDQAVEEILESELMARLERQPPPAPPPAPHPPPAPSAPLQPPSTVHVQLLQNQPSVSSSELFQTAAAALSPEEEEEKALNSHDETETVNATAVKHISSLLQSSKSRTRLAGRARLSLSHTVLLSLTLLTRRLSYRSVSRRFQLEKGNIHRIFYSFCQRVTSLQDGIIRWPEGQEAAESLFPFCSFVGSSADRDAPQVLGILGNTRIPIRLPIGKHDVERGEVKRMKKKAHPDSWLNLELACDRTGRFFHCRISAGSDADRGVALRDRLKLNPQLVPAGSFLLAKPGYPLSAQVLTPHARTHGPREELFNRTMQQHFHILDRAVASLRTRFQRLRYLDIGKYDRARAVVLTACVLHNVFLDIGNAVQGEVEEEEAMTALEGGQEEEEEEEEGVRTRDAITDFLFAHSGNV